VDPVTFAVLDMITYIANMSSPNYQTHGPVWQKYYSAKETYGPLVTPPLTNPMAELTPAFWHNLTAVFESNDAVFQGYYARKSRGWDVSSCTGTCKTEEICQMKAGQAQYNCVPITPGINFVKRDEQSLRFPGHVHETECQGSRARPILAKLAAREGMLEEALQRAREKYKI
jgi:sphingomyelin phosphodiesterase